MATDKTVNELIINKLTQAQFDAIPEAERSDTELYFITDAEISGDGKGAQVEEMPEATETNAGQIVQYVGETISGKDTTTITQVVGNSLTNLKVNSKKFAEKLGITAAETIEFTHNINRGFNNTSDYIYPDGNAVSVVITNPTLLLTAIEQFLEQYLEYYPQNSFDNVIQITFDIGYSEEKSQNIVAMINAVFRDDPFTSYQIANYINHDLDEEHIGVVVGNEYPANELWNVAFDLLNQVFWKNDNIDVVLPSDGTIQFTTTKGNITFECGYQDFINYLTDTSIIPRNWKNEDIPEYLLKSSFTYNSGNNCWVYPPLAGIDDSWVRNFMQISGDVQDGDSVEYVLTLPNEGNVITNIKQYGITYSGTPSTDDKIKIDYYPPVSSYEKGYFYTNKEQLTSPEIIITQTTGNSLSNLKIDEDIFIKAENPTSDLTTTFRVASGGTSYEIEEKIGDYELSIDVSKVVAFAIDKLHSELKHGFLNGEQLRITIQDYRNQPDNSAYPWWVDIWTPSTGTINVGNRMATYWLTDIFGVDFDAESINDIGTLVFSCYYSEPTWIKNNDSQITLSDYGISFTKGVPALGDVITVDYRSPTYYGMSWEQINVQPSTGSANNIEWVTILDVPADFSSDYRQGCSPIWSVPADLPDGTYEFYVQTLCGSIWDPVIIGLCNYTVKVLVKFYTEDNVRRHIGSISYVLDGSWTGDGEHFPENNEYYNCFSIDENKLYFIAIGTHPFCTSLPHYVGNVDVPGAFKMSAWKNIESGEQYIPQGTLFDGTRPNSSDILGLLYSYQLWPGIQYPSYHMNFNCDINSDYQYIHIIPYEILTGTFCQELVIDMKSSTGGKYHAIVRSQDSSCFIKECEASGDLANVQLGLDGNHNSYIYINDKNNSVSHIEIQLSASGIADTTRNVYLEYDWYTVNNFVPLSVYNVGAPVTKGNLDRILQYTQESTDEYTQGYFYKSVGDIIDIPEKLTLVKIPESDFEISLVDDKDVISILSSLTGWAIERITQNLKYAQFAYFYSAGNPYIWCNMFGDLYDQELLSCFNVIPESEAPDGYPQYVEFMLQYIPASQKVENGRWERVNVQPASNSNTTQVTEMPEASEENAGKILQYIGTPTSEYDQGYFYKSVVVSQTESGISASIKEGEPYADELSVSIDSEKLIAVINRELGLSSGLYRFAAGSGVAMLGKLTADGKTEKHVMFNWEPTLENLYGEVGITLTLAESGSAPDLSNYTAVRIDIVYSESQIVCEWRQVNVQPSSGGGGEAPSELPNLTGNEGRFLSNNGSELEWVEIELPGSVDLPDQTGNGGKFLTTDGENTSWAEIELPESTGSIDLPEQTGNSGKFLTTDGTNLSWANTPSGGGDGLAGRAPSGGIMVGEGADADTSGVAIGDNSWSAGFGVAVGKDASATSYGTAIGPQAIVDASDAVQIGWGRNEEASTLKVGLYPANYTLLTSDGFIPSDRLAINNGESGQVLTLTNAANGIMEWVTPTTSNMNIPAHPTAPGSYMLMCTVGEDGTASYSWETVA